MKADASNLRNSPFIFKHYAFLLFELSKSFFFLNYGDTWCDVYVFTLSLNKLIGNPKVFRNSHKKSYRYMF